jgi:hypothetical protein
VTFDETAPYTRDVLECVGDKEIEERIFVDEKLQSFDRDKDELLPPSTYSPEFVPAFILEPESSQATTSSTSAVEASWVEGEMKGAPSHIQKTHPPQ